MSQNNLFFITDRLYIRLCKHCFWRFRHTKTTQILLGHKKFLQTVRYIYATRCCCDILLLELLVRWPLLLRYMLWKVSSKPIYIACILLSTRLCIYICIYIYTTLCRTHIIFLFLVTRVHCNILWVKASWNEYVEIFFIAISIPIGFNLKCLWKILGFDCRILQPF